MSVAERVTELLSAYSGMDRAVTGNPNAHLVDDLEFDGLDFVDFALACEEAFGVIISDVADLLSTVGDWIAMVEARG